VLLGTSGAIYGIQILSGLGSAAGLFLVASGLTLIFGALRVINFAHGSLYMIGAYLAITFSGKIGFGNYTFFATVLVASILVALIGLAAEVTVFRRIYQRTVLTQLIVTFAFVLIIGGAMRQVYGTQAKLTGTPPFLKGGVHLFGGSSVPDFSIYQIFLIALAGVVAIALWAILYKTNLGRDIRAAVSDPELLSYSGVNVRILFTGVFMLGCFFAGLAGATFGQQGGVDLTIDVQVILRAFVIIVIGGLGSLRGALVASILVGVVEALGTLWVPKASLVIVFAVLVAVLAVRPQGLFGTRTA
jgi:branched-subunit amino acid ABC-type transport system permease component